VRNYTINVHVLMWWYIFKIVEQFTPISLYNTNTYMYTDTTTSLRFVMTSEPEVGVA